MKLLRVLVLVTGCWAACGAAMTFVHPGALNSATELDFVKNRNRAGAQPWAGEVERLKASAYATRGPHAMRHVNSTTADAEVARDDVISAYAQALLWSFTGEPVYAERSLAILDVWSGLEGFTAGTQQDRLLAGWLGAVLAPAAEIMRGHREWSTARTARLAAMFRRAFYPQLEPASTWNGNVDLTQIDALLAIAVFNEGEPLFRRGLERLRVRSVAYIYLATDGPLPAAIAGDGGDRRKFWFNPVSWVDGLTQETGRDNGHHSQFGLGSALHAAETAWHQGVDVYAEHQARYVAAMELLAGQLLAGSMRGVSPNDIPTPDRYDTWEVGYNHYHNRCGLDLPNTRRLLEEQIRPRAARASWNLVFETLTHAGEAGSVGAR
jgi:hypothetical protein